MSSDLHDVFKRELDQIPLRPAETWVPANRRSRGGGVPSGLGLAVAGGAIVIVVALIVGQQLAAFRLRNEAASGAGARALYLSSSFNGSGWIRIDPLTLKDMTAKPLLPIAPTSQNSSYTLDSQDGSTVLVADFVPTPARYSVYDAKTGALRGPLVPEVNMVIDGFSADGRSALGRLGNNSIPIYGAKAVISVDDGRVLRSVGAVDLGSGAEVQAFPIAPDLSAIYYFITPQPIGVTDTGPLGLQPLSLRVQDTRSGAVSPAIALPGITAGAILSFGSPITPSTPTTYRPGIALSRDGAKLAVLSFDGRTLDLIDTKTFAVTSLQVRPKTSLTNGIGPRVAKTINDVEARPITFTPDGSAVLSHSIRTHYSDLGSPVRMTSAIQRIEIRTGLVVAERQISDEGTYGFYVGADGGSLYLVERLNAQPIPTYVLRRLDAMTLEIRAERALADYVEMHILSAP